jgi:hypothetical protein
MLLLVEACGGARGGASASPSAVIQIFPVETLQVSGDPSHRINLVVLGDGYREADQDKLTHDAQAWLAAFKGTAPYGNYAAYFNIKLVHVVSKEDGAGNGAHGFGVMRDTALGATFQNASPAGQPPDFRLLVVDNALAQAVATAHAPECTKVLVIVNDANYGGSGGAVPVFSVNPASCLIALHEFGHSFGGLADEYSCGDTSALQESIEAYPNVTTRQTLDQIKWNSWIPDGTPLPTPDTWANAAAPGLFEGAYYHDCGVYRPRHACRMRALNDAFCEVCSEAIVRGVYGRVSLIDSATPASPVQLEEKSPLTLSITHPAPSPNTLQATWIVDGVAVAGAGDRFDLPAGGLEPGAHTISVRLADATPFVRLGRAGLVQVHTWSVIVAGSAAVAPLSVHTRGEHQLLRVVRDAAGFRVVDRQIVPLPLPLEPSQVGRTWQVEVLGQDGQVLFEQGIEDPSLLRGEFQNMADPGRMDGYRLDGNRPASFLIRMPVTEAHRLEFYGHAREGSGRHLLGRASLKESSTP